MLDIVPSYHCMSLEGKLMNRKKHGFGSNFGAFDPNSGFHFPPPKNLSLSVTRNHGQLSQCTISEKLIYQSWENLVTNGRTDRKSFNPNIHKWFEISLINLILGQKQAGRQKIATFETDCSCIQNKYNAAMEPKY